MEMDMNRETGAGQAVRLVGVQDLEDGRMVRLLAGSRSEGDFVDRLREAMEAGERSVIAGFAGDVPAGYAVVNWRPTYSLFARLDIPELQDLNVLPDYRRNGLGQEIVLGCEGLVRQRGYTQIGLGVGLDKSYGAAQRLYIRLGYMPDGFGISHDRETVAKGQVVRVDDDLCLMMVKGLLP